MKFLPHAAAIAAVTFCVGAIANAATLEANSLQDVPLQELNQLHQHVVPSAGPDPRGLAPGQPRRIPGEIVQPLPIAPADRAEARRFASLSDAVEAQGLGPSDDPELHCLAVGVYYESNGEPLAGQLAVAEVILNRTTSGRFPRSVCGVLTQRGQFSFVRGGRLPAPPNNAGWRRARAVAQVARADLWDSPVENALFFHARYVSPRWRRARVGTVGNHIFYR